MTDADHASVDRPPADRPPTDDEISLVDLFAVLLRYRRLILVLPLVTAVAALAYLYALPLLLSGPGSGDAVYAVEQEVFFSPVLPQATRQLSRSPAGLFDHLAQDVRTVAAVYEALEEDPAEDRSQAAFYAYIQDEVIGERLTTSYSSEDSVLTLRFESHDPEHAADFLDALISEVSARFPAALEPQIIVALRNVEIDLQAAESAITLVSDTARQSGSVSSTLTMQALSSQLSQSFDSAVNLYTDAAIAQSELETLQQNLDTAYTVESEPLVLLLDAETGQSRAVTTLIAIFAAAFFAVFLAFVLNYMRLVRNDPAEYGKLREALERN